MAAGKKSNSNSSSDRGGYVLRVPLDASKVEDRDKIPALKAALITKEGVEAVTTVKIGRNGTAVAEFKLKKPVAGRVAIGPEDARDDELERLQTLGATITRRAWTDNAVELRPIIITPWYWRWWLRWCRTFTIRGRLTCPDGNPVPGAEVCAYDVDRFWWWCSKQRVGCDVTDENGAFSITFRWCCGWWPWWWWQLRSWQLDHKLLGEITKLTEGLPELPKPDPVPNFEPFEKLVAETGTPRRPKQQIKNPAELDGLRKNLLERLPVSPRMETLRIWPWAPWHPWVDCTPDIIFRATQDCGQGEVVILDEDCSDARWNIPTALDVSLVATNEACCAHQRPPVCGDEECVVLTHVCDDLVEYIGGNIGALAAPEGYRSPSLGVINPTSGHDRPYGGVIPISAVCADWIDYYAFESSDDNGVTWTPLPPAATGGVTQTYFDPGGPPYFLNVPFNFQLVDGRWVAETLGHWESVNGPRIWVGDVTRMIYWRTDNIFADGTYRLRLRGYRETAGGLQDLGIPPLCGDQAENFVTITVDNRIVGPGSGHPTSPSHPVPAGGVHLETTEPDTDFVAIRHNGQTVGACGSISRAEITPQNPLTIDFLAADSDAHLAWYSMQALWGENNAINLLSQGTLSVLSGGPEGPGYGDALAQGAIAPDWGGGTMRLTITNGTAAFPVACCYALDLRAYKRTIVSCNDNFPYRNRSTLTLAIT